MAIDAQRQRCGQLAPDGSGRVCERWQHHEGEHRGYHEQIDEPVFWRVDPFEIRDRAEALWEELGGDLCICQRPDVPHWCETCQQRIDVILAAFRLLLYPDERRRPTEEPSTPP